MDNRADEEEEADMGKKQHEEGEEPEYEEEETGGGDIVSLGIAQRVSTRRQGCRHKGGGNMEQGGPHYLIMARDYVDYKEMQLDR